MSRVADSIVRIPCKLDNSFFKYWFKFLHPFHNLTEREMDVITCLVKERYELSKVIKDNDILDRVTMGEDTRKKIMDELGINNPHFQVVLTKLRKNKIIIDNKINPRYIPAVKEENGSFKMMLLFEFS
jgi:hypothetical protein|nr:MAG TPA: hypothetical protein [Crassvirales sp.]